MEVVEVGVCKECYGRGKLVVCTADGPRVLIDCWRCKALGHARLGEKKVTIETRKDDEMPRLQGVREQFDTPLYATAKLRAGEVTSFFDCRGSLGEDQTNVYKPWIRPRFAYVVLGLGLRLVGVAPGLEDMLLDHLSLTMELCDKKYGPWPGNLLSTFRHAMADEDVDPMDAPTKCLPGYILAIPLVLPSERSVSVSVKASEDFGGSALGRVFLFGVKRRDWV